MTGPRTAKVVLVDGHACECGQDRQEIVKAADELFEARTGCLRCDRWDGPPGFAHRRHRLTHALRGGEWEG